LVKLVKLTISYPNNNAWLYFRFHTFIQ